MHPQRRTYSKSFKAQVIQECSEPGASIANIALGYSLNANLVHKWIRLAWHASRFTNGAECRTATRLDTGLAMAESWPRKRHFHPLSRAMPHQAAQLSDKPVVAFKLIWQGRLHDFDPRPRPTQPLTTTRTRGSVVATRLGARRASRNDGQDRPGHGQEDPSRQNADRKTQPRDRPAQALQVRQTERANEPGTGQFARRSDRYRYRCH